MKPSAIRDARRLYDIRDILGLKSNKRIIVCPLPGHPHKHNTPSFSIFTTPDGIQKWVCHGACSKSGDSVDLAGYLKIPGYNPKNGDHVKEALALLSGNIRINPPKPESTRHSELNNGLWKHYLPVGAEVLAYAAERFLTPETLERFKVGQKTSSSAIWMTMPTIHGDRLRGIKTRNIDTREKRLRYAQIPGSVDGLFNYNEVRSSRERIMICKGEIAVMILSQAGFTACAPTGGETSYFAHEQWLPALAFSRKRIVVGDNDMRPDVREKVAAGARRRGEIFKAEVYFPPDPYIGVDDWVLADPTSAIPQIREWLR